MKKWILCILAIVVLIVGISNLVSMIGMAVRNDTALVPVDPNALTLGFSTPVLWLVGAVLLFIAALTEKRDLLIGSIIAIIAGVVMLFVSVGMNWAYYDRLGQ